MDSKKIFAKRDSVKLNASNRRKTQSNERHQDPIQELRGNPRAKTLVKTHSNERQISSQDKEDVANLEHSLWSRLILMSATIIQELRLWKNAKAMNRALLFSRTLQRRLSGKRINPSSKLQGRIRGIKTFSVLSQRTENRLLKIPNVARRGNSQTL